MNAIPAAEAGIEIGHIVWVNANEKLGLLASTRVQHDGSMSFTGGISALMVFPKLALFIDFGLGAAWLARTEYFLALHASFGFQIPIVGRVAEPLSIHIKLGAFAELIGDEVNAEPVGVNATLGVTF